MTSANMDATTLPTLMVDPEVEVKSMRRRLTSLMVRDGIYLDFDLISEEFTCFVRAIVLKQHRERFDAMFGSDCIKAGAGIDAMYDDWWWDPGTPFELECMFLSEADLDRYRQAISVW